MLSRLVARVFSVELVDPLAQSAAAALRRLGYANVTVRSGDGYLGWPDEAPFDIILVTAAPEEVPPALVAQLKPGGRLVVPVGGVWDVQDLQLIEKDAGGKSLDAERDSRPLRADAEEARRLNCPSRRSEARSQ
ncbi:MAG: hypothetical protein MZV64_13600 [Ignavibacteriales bacterium]|nr:hypothetical protein [Ignavibacteriales bacterium]